MPTRPRRCRRTELNDLRVADRALGGITTLTPDCCGVGRTVVGNSEFALPSHSSCARMSAQRRAVTDQPKMAEWIDESTLPVYPPRHSVVANLVD